jgi:aryl-alcohol dehydrogenase-like predicted oxidoreductase
VPRAEQLEAVAAMQRVGLIRHIGLSNVKVDDIKAAQKVFRVATVQNLYNLGDRSSEDVLAYCEEQSIGFIPWYPLAAGKLAHPGSVLDEMAKKRRAAPGQIALAWVLKRSPVMLPIPGTGKVSHLEENVAAAAIDLSDDDFRALDMQGREASRA